ncbi:MAG: Holliday junction branch migration protein RuvA [Nitriliruptorales bacterium]
MIGHLRGTIVARLADRPQSVEVVVDVHGVGYRVLVPSSLAARLPAAGEEVELHTSLQVREDAMDLYGFPSLEARELFESLLGASGVGPRLALAALSTHAPPALHRAIADEDVESLTLIPGVGKKLAQRLVLELRDKLGAPAVDLAPVPGRGTGDGVRAEVRLALMELGYTHAEAQRALAALDGFEGDERELLRLALRSLAGAGIA